MRVIASFSFPFLIHAYEMLCCYQVIYVKLLLLFILIVLNM